MSKPETKKRYSVYGTMMISMFVEVEADSEEEARSIAEQAPVKSLCHYCTTAETGEWTLGELDGATELRDVEVIEA